MSDISDLERRIEALRADIERSGKMEAAGKIASVVGVSLFLAAGLGLFGLGAAALTGGVALAVGGVVLSGSSKASTDELRGALRDAEAARSTAIDGLWLVDARVGADNDNARLPTLH